MKGFYRLVEQLRYVFKKTNKQQTNFMKNMRKKHRKRGSLNSNSENNALNVIIHDLSIFTQLPEYLPIYIYHSLSGY